MEYINGETMRKYVKKYKFPQVSYVCLYFIKIINEILLCVHDENVLHLDIKPENIMVQPNCVIKLVDFGLSCIPSIQQKSQTIRHTKKAQKKCCIQGGGSRPMYAPETVLHEKNYKETDIWLLGATIYSIMTDTHIWGNNLNILMDNNKFFNHVYISGVPRLKTGNELLDKIVNKCLVKDYDSRISSEKIKKLLKHFNIHDHVTLL